MFHHALRAATPACYLALRCQSRPGRHTIIRSCAHGLGKRQRGLCSQQTPENSVLPVIKHQTLNFASLFPPVHVHDKELGTRPKLNVTLNKMEGSLTYRDNGTMPENKQKRKTQSRIKELCKVTYLICRLCAIYFQIKQKCSFRCFEPGSLTFRVQNQKNKLFLQQV